MIHEHPEGHDMSAQDTHEYMRTYTWEVSTQKGLGHDMSGYEPGRI